MFVVYNKLNARCIPQPFAMTSHPAWGDPVNDTWTTGSQMALTTEGVLWGGFIERHAAELTGSDGRITGAGLVIDNDFGPVYDNVFKAWVAQSPLKDQIDDVTEKIDDSALTISDAMTTLAAKKPGGVHRGDRRCCLHPVDHRSGQGRIEGTRRGTCLLTIGKASTGRVIKSGFLTSGAASSRPMRG